MIRQLRRRFILATMGSVVLVLAVLIAVINIANFVGRDRSSTQIISFLAENGGSFPEVEKPQEPPGKERIQPNEKRRGGLLPDIRDGFPFSAESPYETRYFTVTLDSAGKVVSVDIGKIAAIDESAASEMATELFSSGRTSGYEGIYKYLATASDGEILYIFLDCGRDLDSVQQFLRISILVSLCSIAAIFLLVILLSRRAIRPIEESYRRQKEFITNAGHELKTPLAVIRSCTDVLSLDEDEQNQKWIRGITDQIERLSYLVQELVSLARMDEGPINLQEKEFNLTGTVQEVLEPFALSAEAKSIDFSADFDGEIMYTGDPRAIAQLISILADNAVKYTPENGYIHFSLEPVGRHIVLSCENATEYMTPGKKDQFFERFYRGDESHSSRQTGYGIGLSMARSIAAAHNGKMEAVSVNGRELKITVRL